MGYGQERPHQQSYFGKDTRNQHNRTHPCPYEPECLPGSDQTTSSTRLHPFSWRYSTSGHLVIQSSQPSLPSQLALRSNFPPRFHLLRENTIIAAVRFKSVADILILLHVLFVDLTHRERRGRTGSVGWQSTRWTLRYSLARYRGRMHVCCMGTGAEHSKVSIVRKGILIDQGALARSRTPVSFVKGGRDSQSGGKGMMLTRGKKAKKTITQSSSSHGREQNA